MKAAAAIGFGAGLLTYIFMFYKKKYNSADHLFYNHIFSHLAPFSLESGVIPASMQPRFSFISNPSFLSKIQEKLVLLVKDKIFDKSEVGFRKPHCTDTNNFKNVYTNSAWFQSYFSNRKYLLTSDDLNSFLNPYVKNQGVNALQRDIKVNQIAKSIFYQSYPLVKPFDNLDVNLGNSHSSLTYLQRVTTGAPKQEYFTQVLRTLHRLPLRHNIGLKMFSLIPFLAPLRALRPANPRVYPTKGTSLRMKIKNIVRRFY